MVLKSVALLFFLLPVACASEEIERVEKYRIDYFVASPVCSIWVDDVPEKENIIIENLLDLNDSIYHETFLHLYENGKFNIIKSDQTVLSGDWHMNENDFTFTNKA
jgi:hypothetical protein